MLEHLVVSGLNGIVYGMLLFMLASGLTLIFGMMGVLNLAHAGLYMLGAYFGFQITQIAGFVPALLIAPVLIGILGAVIERYALRRVHKHGHIPELLFTFGLAFVIQEVIHMVWGRIAVPYRVPAALEFHLFYLFETPYPAYRMFMLLISVGIFVFLFGILTWTRIGLIIRAALTHPDMVSILGHNVPRVFMLVFGIGSALAAIAGVIGGPIFVTAPNMAETLGAILFVVVVVGGLGSLTGALITSLVIGLLQTFAVSMSVSLADLGQLIGISIPRTSRWADLWYTTIAQLSAVLPYLLLLAILVVRPRGLFGSRDV